MSPPVKRLSIIVAILAAGALLVVILAGGESADDPGPPLDRVGPVAATLLALGEGPAGSAPVALTRWRYRSDREDRGRRKGWAQGIYEGREVLVPYSPNARRVTSERSYQGSIGWFTRQIDAPVRGRYALSFESAHHEAIVYLDGRRVRRHVGAYDPFSAVLPLSKGRHTVTVRVDWRDPEGQKEAGFARGWFNFGGLNRPVTLSRMGDSEIGALNVSTKLRESAADVRVRARVRNRGATRVLRAQGSITHDGERTPLTFEPVRVKRGTSRTITAKLRLDDPALWAPSRPERYDLRIDIRGEASLRRKIGLRQIRWGGQGFTLNDRPLRLQGASLPADVEGRGDAQTPDDEARTVQQLRSVGANATRSQLPLSRSMLDKLDAAGILVWQEIGPWEPAAAFRNPVAVARARALRTAELQQAHPSILTWTLTNEAAREGRPGQVEFVVQTAAELHRRDPGRPVAIDLWSKFLTKRATRMFAAVDALGMTDYMGWYEGVNFNADGQDEIVRRRIEGLRELFPEKPLVVTELGAAGTRRIADDDFGGRNFQAKLLARRLRFLADTPGVSGAIVWLLRDHALRPDFRGGSVRELVGDLDLAPGINEKGLFDYAGRPKPAFDAVRAVFTNRGG